MPRHPELEKILQAWYEWEGCHSSEKDRHREILNELVDATRAGTHLSRQDLIQALANRYRAFRTAKDREMLARLSRLKLSLESEVIIVQRARA